MISLTNHQKTAQEFLRAHESSLIIFFPIFSSWSFTTVTLSPHSNIYFFHSYIFHVWVKKDLACAEHTFIKTAIRFSCFWYDGLEFWGRWSTTTPYSDLATGWMTEESWLYSRQKQYISSFLEHPDRIWGPPRHPFVRYRRLFSRK